jgi:L-threonate 2-dehydrogenase
MMVAQDYDEPSARMELFVKDVDVIDDFARSIAAPVPIFSATLALYAAALAQGRADQDPAAVHDVLATLAGLIGEDASG